MTVLDVRRRVRREVRMHRCRVVIVVVGVHVRVQERRTHRATLNGKRQPEREDTTDHVAILAQNGWSWSEEFLNASSDYPRFHVRHTCCYAAAAGRRGDARATPTSIWSTHHFA
jgi:hypothetical protein